MIFNFIFIIQMVFFVLDTENVPPVEKPEKSEPTEISTITDKTPALYIDDPYNDYEYHQADDPPQILKKLVDLNGDGVKENVVIKSFLGFPDNQRTEIYINSTSKPVKTEIGYFFDLKVYKMDSHHHFTVELQLESGQTVSSYFYTYNSGKLVRVPLSTDIPPDLYGIQSRNIPDIKDINQDGVKELLAYEGWYYEPTRLVDVYKFTGHSFVASSSYEETNPYATQSSTAAEPVK